MLITLPLYVLRELGKALGLALLVFSFVLLAFFAGRIIRDGAGVMTTLTVLPRLFPLISPMVLPLTIITGTLICYGRLASGNEFMAVQASGVHPGWVAAPALAVAVLAATITVFLNADVLTLATRSIESALVREKTEILRRRLSRPGSFTFKNVAITRLSPDTEGRSGVDITFFAQSPPPKGKDGEPLWHPEYPHQAVRLIARDHRIDLRRGEGGDFIVEATLSDLKRYDVGRPEMQVLTAASAKPHWSVEGETSKVSVNADRMTFWGISEILRKRVELRALLEEQTAAAARLREAGDVPGAEGAAWEANRTRKRIRKHTAELHLKLVLSFACIGFGALGVPLGLLARKESLSTGFAYGMVVALFFYVFVKALGTEVEGGRLDVWIMWLPNVILLAAGGFLWIRSGRRR